MRRGIKNWRKVRRRLEKGTENNNNEIMGGDREEGGKGEG